MARIGIDATSVSCEGKGVSRYQKNLVKALSRLNSPHEYFVFVNAREKHPSDFIESAGFRFVPIVMTKALFWEQAGIPREIRRYRLDLFHATTDRLPCFGGGSFVLQIFETPASRSPHPGAYGRAAHALHLILFPFSLKRASLVLASSEHTRQELVQKYGVEAAKTRLVPLAHEEAFVPASNEEIARIRQRLDAPDGYVLHFSTGDERENTVVAIEAFAKAKSQMKKDVKLLLVGCGSRFFEENIRLHSLSGAVILNDYLPESALLEAYQGASAYLDPSLHEGFALQVLEAMACGVPVVASNRTCIPEITGDAAILADAADSTALGMALTRIVNDESLASDMRARGLQRAAAYRWKNTAQLTLAAFEEALHGR